MDSDIREEPLSDFDDALDRVIKNAVKILGDRSSNKDSVKHIKKIMRHKEDLKEELSEK